MKDCTCKDMEIPVKYDHYDRNDLKDTYQY